jgi:uncharacterized membrane protein
MTSALLFLSAFLASGVEFVEALTIVLALGSTRGWRSPLVGAGAAALGLAVMVAALGPALLVLPIEALRLAVGAVLLPFGLQWLRKAILRASGYVALHDEEEAYRRETEEARRAGARRETGLDWYSFTLSFKSVLLEGLEAAFIVITFGSSERNLPLAALGGGVALVLVIGAGIALRAPLARIPENTVKFAVGILLTTFGIFWGAEGTGVSWPGDELALLGILVLISLSALVLVRVLRAQRSVATPARART